MEEEHFNKLLVEGKDDLHVISALCMACQIPESFEIISCGSVEKAIRGFRLRLTTPKEQKILGIVVDADVNAEARWEELKAVLSASGKYDCDALQLPSEGLVLTSNDPDFPTVGVWVMPDNQLSGMLEDFVISLTDPSDVLMVKAESVLTELESESIQKYKSAHRAKAKIHTFLSWQDEPGKPMGTAITSRVLNPEANTAQQFVSWLNRLFNS